MMLYSTTVLLLLPIIFSHIQGTNVLDLESEIFSEQDFPTDNGDLGGDGGLLEAIDPTTIKNPLNSQEVRAIAVLRGYGVTEGIINLSQLGSGAVRIHGVIAGLRPSGSHGFHVHEYAVTGDCDSAGAHYNPNRRQHGGQNTYNRHLGDLGNVHADHHGVARINLSDLQISLIGPYTVIGRSLVVHINKDDLGNGRNRESKTTGNSGARLACGTIRFVEVTKGPVHQQQQQSNDDFLK